MARWCGTEAERAEALSRYTLDAGRLDALKEITDFVAPFCGAPIALVCLVDEHRQRYLAKFGLDIEGTPRDVSFCAHAMLEESPFIIHDASADPRFADNPLVTGDPGIRFYAGAPLVSPEGVPLGSLCVIDMQPRPQGLTPLQTQGLTMLSHRVVALMEGRRRDEASRQQRDVDAQALAESELRFRTLADSMPQMVWSTRPDGFHDYFNARWYEYIGLPEGSTLGEAWNAMLHVDDQALARERWIRSLETGAPYEIEYRLRHRSGQYRWALGRALPLRNAAGDITRWFGTCTDIHEQKLTLEEREMIAHELSHRIKNIFSVINGLIGLSTREHPEIAVATDELRERVMALGRAHDFVRPHSANSTSELGQNSLQGVLQQIFAPYGESRVILAGDDIEIDDRSATPLALVFHELATNAAKYGALSVADGKVALHVCRDGETCVIDWSERLGPAAAVPVHEGFGSRLISLSVERQMNGTIERRWLPEGLQVSLRIPLRSMSRGCP